MFTIQIVEELESSNDTFKQHADEYQDRSVLVALRQTKGRGRFTRVWESKDDLTFSILWKQPYPHEFIAPLAVVLALQEFGIVASIKWPNDVLVDGKKVCGILIERLYEGNAWKASVVGIGLNLTQKDTIDTSGYVPLQREPLLQAILTHYEALCKKSVSTLMEEIKKVFYLHGKSILINGIIWNVDGMDANGHLCVHHEEHKRVLRSEEVSLEAIYGKEII